MIRRLGDLAAGLPDALVSGSGETAISDIQYDSRLVTPGCLFAALRGWYVDGHGYVHGAIERGHPPFSSIGKSTTIFRPSA